MSESLFLQGKLETLPELLKIVMSNPGIVSLKVKRDITEAIFYFENGKIVSAITNDPDFHLPEILFVKGEIDYDSYVKIQESLRKKRSLIEALQESGGVSPDEILRLLEIQLQEILNFCCRWVTGEYIVSFLEKLPENLIPLRINSDRVIINSIRQIQRLSSVKKGIGSFQRKFVRVPEQDTRIYRMELQDEENYILSFFEETRSISEVLNLSYLNNFETLKIIWGLIVLSLIKEEIEVEKKQIDERDREYILAAMVESYNNAFSTIYRGVYQLIGERVNDIVKEIISKLPSNYRNIFSNNILSEEFRIDFDMLNQYLYKEGIKNQMQFLQDFLNEIIYAWILLIRLKFGNKLESVIEEAISEIREA